MGEFGLLFFNARWLDPALGRFAQADIVVPGVGNSQAWDRYAAMNNNTVNYTDSTGHMIDSGCNTEGCTGDPDATSHLEDIHRDSHPKEPENEFTISQKIGKSISFVSVVIFAGISEYSLFQIQRVLVGSGPVGIVIDVLIVPAEFAIADFSVSFGLMTYQEVTIGNDVHFEWVLSNAIADTFPTSVQNKLVEMLPGVFH